MKWVITTGREKEKSHPIRSSSPCRGGWALNEEGALVDIEETIRNKKNLGGEKQKMRKAVTIGLVLCILLSIVVIQAGAEEDGDAAPNVALVVENAIAGSNKITLIHHGGDIIVDAFKGNAPYWNSLGVRINGSIYTGTVKLNGATVSAGDFKPGDELELFLGGELSDEDTITVIYIPTGDILLRVIPAGGVDGAVRGDVYDAQTRSAVEEATVTCEEFWMTAPGVWIPAPSAPETTITDADGHFEFKDISIGASGRKCEITVEHEDYETESRTVYLSDSEPQVYLIFELSMAPTPPPTPTSAPTEEPELSISQSSLKEEPEVGEEVLITIAILNKGKATAKNIHLEENIPSSISVNYVEGADKAGGLVYWNGELDPGEAHSITHTLKILEEKSRTIPVTVTYEDASGKKKQKSTEIYLTAEIEEEETPTPSPLANLPWVYIIILVAVILVGLAIIVAVRRGGEGGGAEVTIEESK